MKSFWALASYRVVGKVTKLATTCILIGGIVSWQAPAAAGSDSSSVTYAGDYQAGSLPSGTFIAVQHAGFGQSNAFVDTTGNALPNSHATIWEEFTRFAYLGQFAGHPLAIDVDVPVATLTNVNAPSTNNLVQGGATDPVVDVTYFFLSDAQTERWLGLTDYLYIPLGLYNSQKALNVATPDQFTDVPQIGYTEGLGKLSPDLKSFFFDVIANASIHTNGRNPINFINPANAPSPGILSYNTLTQSTSYDVKAFLRYEPKPLEFVAVGVEKAWGGEQIAVNGRFAVTGAPLVIPQPALPLSKDDYLRGHLQFQVPLTQDFAVAADLFHDFDRVGGFREDIGAEIRLSKLFFSQPPSK